MFDIMIKLVEMVQETDSYCWATVDAAGQIFIHTAQVPPTEPIEMPTAFWIHRPEKKV